MNVSVRLPSCGLSQSNNVRVVDVRERCEKFLLRKTDSKMRFIDEFFIKRMN